jgi:hypothetical protein
MREHKDDFIAFLPSIGGEDTAGATDDGMMDDAGFEKYCRMVAETGEWGGEPEVGSFFFSLIFSHPILDILPLRIFSSLACSSNPVPKSGKTDIRSKHSQEHSRSQSTSFKEDHPR